MKKITLSLLFFLSVVGSAFAGQINNPYTGKPDIIPTITEADGSPKIETCRTIKFSNSTVTDNGDTTCSVTNSGGSSGVAWGAITGTLSDQSDLQTALDAKSPANATYLTKTAESGLSAEFSLGSLTTGLLLNTVSAGTGTPSAYGGTSCINQFPRSLNASGAATCASVSLTADITGTLAVGNGGTGASSASITAFNNITGYTASGATGTTSTNLVFSTSPTLVTPTLGAATATTINKVTFTTPASGSTLTVADGKTLTASNTVTLTGTDSVSINLSNTKLGQLCFHFGDASTTISTGEKKAARLRTAKAGTITGWTILSMDDTSSSITLDVWRDDYAHYPPTVADSVPNGGTKPSVTTATSNTSTTLTSWLTSFSAGDIFSVNVDSNTAMKDILLCLDVTYN